MLRPRRLAVPAIATGARWWPGRIPCEDSRWLCRIALSFSGHRSTRLRSLLAVVLGLVCAGALYCSPASAGAKTDKVSLINGDVVTCEIKELDRGVLSCKTDSMGTVSIEWVEVVQILSTDYTQLVELDDGTRMLGNLAPPQEPGNIRVVLGEFAREVELSSVVRIAPIKKKVVGGRLKGGFSLGFSFTKSAEVAQLNGAADLNYRTQKYLLTFDGSTNFTRQRDDTTTERAVALLEYRRFLLNRWFWLTGGSLERNDELGIDLRVSVGGGGGRWLIQSHRMLFSVAGGMVVNREFDVGDDDPSNNLDALFAADYHYFILNTPKRDVNVSLQILPSLTEANRVRTNFDSRFRLELISDFFWEFRFYANQDTKPPSGALSETDYGVVTSLGYTF
jgi:hypothetical protein